MSNRRMHQGSASKTLVTLAGFAGVVAVLSTLFTVAAPREALAQYYPGQIRYQFRQSAIPTGVKGRWRVALWILNPVFGKIRLCLIDDPAAKPAALKCSGWQGGNAEPGRYSMMDVRALRRKPYHFPPTAGSPDAIGVWVLNYATGAAQICLVGDLKDPAGSLTCSKSE